MHKFGIIIVIIVFAVVVALSLADIGGIKPQVGVDANPTEPQKAQEKDKPVTVRLPQPRSGTVSIKGTANAISTGIKSYKDLGGTANISLEEATSEQAFKDLCAGEIDLASTTVVISRAQWELCKDNGLEVVQIQLASEAIVVVGRSETDFGADCLTTDEIYNIFRAGSPYYNWNQLEYDNVPMLIAGTSLDNDAKTLFAQHLSEEIPNASTNIRSDAHIFDSDDETRRFIVGSEEDRVKARLAVARRERLTHLVAEQEEAQASLRLARTELTAAKNDRAKGIRDQRSARQQSLDQDRVKKAQTAYNKALAYYQRVKREASIVRKRSVESNQALKRIESLRGRIGYMRFGTYELYEEQLRPLEFDASDNEEERDCIFPSRITIANGKYPLSRQFILTTTTRALERNEVEDLLRSFLQTLEKDAQAAHLIPTDAADRERYLSWINGTAEPQYVILSDGDEKTDEVVAPAPAR